jgi:ATP-dependent Lon protease
VRVSRAAVREIVTGYTQEAGVRSLEREIGRMLRNVARRFAEGELEQVAISVRNLRSYLGNPQIHGESIPSAAEVGLARGLAWTEFGGAVLVVEATKVRGRGLILTGQLGDVMKESAQAALSWVKWRGAELGLADEVARNEIHVHVPAGATPKDGPSAGITIAVAMVSLLSGVPVRSDVAMTGEVTLRGRVLPVGGIREKALAALRRGIRKLIIPDANRHDLDELPPELARQLEFSFVHSMDEVLELALVDLPGARRRAPRSGPHLTPPVVNS